MAKLFGCPINVEAGEEVGGGSSIAAEVSRSGNQPDGDAMSLSAGLPPFNQRVSNPYFRFLESNSESGSVSMDSESDLHNCFIDFFDREPYEVETVGEFYIGSNQRLCTWGDFNILGFQDMEEKIELGLAIGSGSRSEQLRGDSGGLGLQVTGNKEIDSGRVEVGTGLTPVGDDLFGEEVGTGLTLVGDDLFGEEEAMLADEELEWEDLQNAITWVSEPVQANFFSLEEEEEDLASRDDNEEDLASRDDNEEDEQDLEWQVLLPVNHVGLFEDFFEESVDIMVESADLMDFDYGVFLSSIDEYGENHGDYDDVLARTFDEPGFMGSPPASKRVVDDLPVVEITSEELSNGNIACAICKDEIVVEEKVKRLPCRHYYHGDCIIPWLGIRNTCPVCRYELPTDDLEYETIRRSQRRGSSGLARDLMSE